MGQCARVVERVTTAQENGGHLDLSECQLTQIPDAIFLLMKNTNLQTCSLAGNLISKIPTKLAVSFSLITELNLSNNRISALPTEMTKLKSLNASKNFLADVELETVSSTGLETLNLEGNPLSKASYEELSKVTTVRVLLSPREQEDWEDLSI